MAYNRQKLMAFSTLLKGILMLYIGLMIMIPIFDFIFPHQIIILFLMVLGSNFGVFLGLWELSESKNGGLPSEVMLERFQPVKMAVPILYLLCLILSFIPATGAYCRSDLVYRNSQPLILKIL
jgi:hypothetical protein